MHGPLAAIESSLLKNGAWQASGLYGEADLAERHLDYWNGCNMFYNADLMWGSGGLVTGTGNYKILAAYISRGLGPVWEVGASSAVNPRTEFSADYKYFYVPEIVWLNAGEDLSNIDEIKRHIMAYGPVASAISWLNFNTGWGFYVPPESTAVLNHSIAIIGWDDNRYMGSSPPGRGAWLCKSSEGTSWWYDGYLWVSYYDKYVGKHPELGAVGFRNPQYVPDGYYYNYSFIHANHGWCDTKTDCQSACNSYTAERDVSLHSVAFYTTSDSVTYTVTIYGSFTSGILSDQLATVSGQADNIGYHTVNLSQSIEVLQGEDVHIFLEVSDNGYAMDRTMRIMDVLGGGGQTLVSRAHAGESYFYTGADWVDLHAVDTTANFCIVGLAKELAPPPLEFIDINDGGDGQSLLAIVAPPDTSLVKNIRVYCVDTLAHSTTSHDVTSDITEVRFDGLIENHVHMLYGYFYDGRDNPSRYTVPSYATPHSLPAQPADLVAMPIPGAIELTWGTANNELDFDHYDIIRDGAPLAVTPTDTFYIDNDPLLGTNLHTYVIRAVDSLGNYSDTSTGMTATARVATLAPDRVIAINKSSNTSAAMVDEIVTGEFLREALAGYDFDYMSDTAGSGKAGLMDFVSYSTVVIGAEGGRRDELGEIIDDLGYYYSIGGKVIIFGRWGDIAVDDYIVDTVFFLQGTDPYGYTDYFGVKRRVRPKTLMQPSTISLISDMIGAHSQVQEFPDLACDSAALVNHSGVFQSVTGVPCPSFPIFVDGDQQEVIYTYNSSTDSVLTEGQPVAWRNLNGDYVFFEMPLSFMERESAVGALRAALATLGIPTSVDDDNDVIPGIFSLRQNYPNPFNATTMIEFYNPQPRPVEMRMEVFNILGQRVRIVFDGYAQPGVNRVEWDGCNDGGQNVASGIYFYRLKGGNDYLTRKMILLK